MKEKQSNSNGWKDRITEQDVKEKKTKKETQ